MLQKCWRKPGVPQTSPEGDVYDEEESVKYFNSTKEIRITFDKQFGAEKFAKRGRQTMLNAFVIWRGFEKTNDYNPSEESRKKPLNLLSKPFDKELYKKMSTQYGKE